MYFCWSRLLSWKIHQESTFNSAVIYSFQTLLNILKVKYFGSAVNYTYSRAAPNFLDLDKLLSPIMMVWWSDAAHLVADIETPDRYRCLNSVAIVSRVSFNLTLNKNLNLNFELKKTRKKSTKWLERVITFGMTERLCLSASLSNTNLPPPLTLVVFAVAHITWGTWNFSDISEKDNWVTWSQVEYMDSHTEKWAFETFHNTSWKHWKAGVHYINTLLCLFSLQLSAKVNKYPLSFLFLLHLSNIMVVFIVNLYLITSKHSIE